MEEMVQAYGCCFIILALLMSFVIGPACFGGAVHDAFGINDMGYWEKWVGGGFSGLGLPSWLMCYAIKQYVSTPFFNVELKRE